VGKCVTVATRVSSRPEQGNAEARVLERVGLGVLSRWLPSARLCEVLVECERMHERDRKLPAPVVMWLLVAAAIFRAVGLTRVLRTISSGAGSEVVPAGSGAVSQARGRLGAAPLALLAERVLGPIADADTPGTFYAGMRVLALDGTGVALPDTEANAEEFGRPGPNAAFPMIRAMVLAEAGTLGIFAGAHGPWKTSEQDLALATLASAAPKLGPDTLVLADRGLGNTITVLAVRKIGAHALLRVKTGAGAAKYPVQQLLADGSWLSTPRISARHRRALGGQLPNGPHTVRVIEFTVTVTSPSGRTRRERIRLVTTLLDPNRWPAAELAALYVQRWCAETAIGLLKIDFLLDKNQLMRSKTPEGIDQELFAALVAYQLIRQLVHSVAGEHGLDPDRISHTGALTEARITLITCPDAEVAYQLARLILASPSHRNPYRPDRAHRRQVRQPTRAWPDLTAHQPDETGRYRYEIHIDWPELGHPPSRDPTVTNHSVPTSRNLN
jgi:hypothetical protein